MSTLSHCSGIVCRNTSHSNVADYHERSFVDNGAHGIQLRHYNNYNGNYYFNPKRIPSDVNNFARLQPRTSDNHIVRISINQNNENTLDSVHRPHIEESESAASVSIVDTDDQSSDEEKCIVIRNSLDNTVITKPTNDCAHQYTEKAVDCPEEFERKAYESQLSPFVRNIQPNSQVCLFTRTPNIFQVSLMCDFCSSFFTAKPKEATN